MAKEIRIPEISENVTSGKVVKVLVKPGDTVEVDDPIIEFETEKAVVEIPSPVKGRISEVLVKEGDELKVGDVIAKIDIAEGEDREEAPKAKVRDQAQADQTEVAEPERTPAEKASPEKAPSPRKTEAKEPAETEGRRQAHPPGPGERDAETKSEPDRGAEAKRRPAEPDVEKARPVPASPSVRRFARELGVDIHAVRAAEPGARITEADIKAYVKKKGPPDGQETGEEPGLRVASRSLPDFSRWGEVDFQELTGVRRLTAESMTVAWQTVVHVTQFDKVDITTAMEFIRRHGDRVAARGGKLTITAILMRICAAALKRFPHFNASIDPMQGQLILKKYIHIGLAVDTPRGLLVPVVRNADRKSIVELAIEIVDLARRTRDKKIKPDEMEGGTFTISNQGVIGGTDFTPVVYWPQAAILGVSQASTEPKYVDGELRPRQVLPLALSYDHRIVDGADAARFLKWIRESIEHPLNLYLD